jgi:hypothetical protein
MDKVLNVAFQRQQTSAWCWAAVASMVSGWYSQQSGSSPLSQCAVAAVTLELPSCCSSSSIDPNCVRLWGLDDALSKTGHYAGTNTSGDLNTVIGQIDAERPLAALINYPGIVHFVLVTGYSVTQQLIVICDPAGSQPFSTPVTAFFSNYNNGGVWGGWYFTKA